MQHSSVADILGRAFQSKEPVKVTLEKAVFNDEAIRSRKSTILKIDRVTDVCCRAADVSGVGDRYECEIVGGNQTYKRYIWFEKGRWFVEAPKKTVDS